MKKCTIVRAKGADRRDVII